MINFSLSSNTSHSMDLNRNQRTAQEQDGGGCSVSERLQIALEILLLYLKIFLAICETLIRQIIPAREKSLIGEVVLVTGAGHGIGRELALQYADLDAVVVCWDINEQSNKNTVAQIKKKGKTAYGYVCDVTKRNHVKDTVEKVKREIGNITVLVNNAGILISRWLLEHDEQDIKRTMDINVMAHFWTLESVLPSMIENNHGHIVALSSYVGLVGLRNLVPYCTSKFAVRGLMSSLREELRYNPQNQIKLTTIFPQIVSTGLCTTQHIRFPKLFKETPPHKAAELIISAQRRDIVEESIPTRSLALHNIARTLPIKVGTMLFEFADIYFESDKKKV